MRARKLLGGLPLLCLGLLAAAVADWAEYAPEHHQHLQSASLWVDFGYPAAQENGTSNRPYSTLAAALSAAGPGASLMLRGDVLPPESAETPTIEQPVRLEAIGGMVRLGVAGLNVPNLLGLQQAEASEDIVLAGFTGGSISDQFSETAPQGEVLDQFPAPGAQLAANAPVHLMVSNPYLPWEAPSPAWIWSQLHSCEINLKYLGVSMDMFTNESTGHKYPQQSTTAGLLMMPESELYPEYLQDTSRLLCPGRADQAGPHFESGHYIYLGYLVMEDQDIQAFASAYETELDNNGDFSSDLSANVSYGGGAHLRRLREGIERFLITDINDPDIIYIKSRVPVMWEWPDNHQAGWGGNVLYMDGHVEFKAYGEFPMTETAINTLASLAGYEAPSEWAGQSANFPYDPPFSRYGYPAACLSHFKHLGVQTMLYANGAPFDYLPPLSPESGRLMMDESAVFPEYVDHPGKLLCPGVPPGNPAPHFEDRDYVYFGYAMLTEGDVTGFATAYANRIAASGDFTTNLPGPSSYGSNFYRLKNGIDRFLITDIHNPQWHKIPVMMEWPDNHEGISGGHVLYHDGSVTWHDYPGAFPMTETVVNTLAELADYTPKESWNAPHPVYLPENNPYGFASTCQQRIKGLALAAASHASDQEEGLYPQLPAEPGRLMYAYADMFPMPLHSQEITICPGPAPVEPPPYFDDQYYVYPGYLLLNDQDVLAFADAYADEAAGAADFSGDLPGPASYGTHLVRLRKNTVELLNSGENAPDDYMGADRIPVAIEWPDHHEGFTGGHVAYLDGSVKWHEYPGEWPMTEVTINALDSIADWPATTAFNSLPFTASNDPHKQHLCGKNSQKLFWTNHTFMLHHDYAPRLSSTPNQLMFASDDVLPYHLDNTRRLNCPGSAIAYDPPAVGDQSYVYLGYLVLNEADLNAFATAYAAEIASEGDFAEDLPATTSYGDAFWRLHEDTWQDLNIGRGPEDFIERGEIPLFIEWPDNHGALRGGNVTYLDGTVQWLDYPGTFPMTEDAMDVLTALAGRGPIAP